MKVTLQENQSLVLIVDNEAFNRQELRFLLEQSGYRVAEAKDGTEAINVFQQLHPELVLLDTILPDMDGFECCSKLLSIDENKHTPVLMITEFENTESIENGFRAGATDYIIKPFYWPVLGFRVRRLIEESQLHQKLVAANLELQRLVTIDFLTQLANRRRFEEYMDHEWRRMARLQQPVSLILLDVDFFKSYNDTYGHQSGDRALIEIAKVIQNVVQRPADLVARYGGEEFAVILPETDALGAAHVAQRICSAIRRLAIPHINSQVSSHVTLSAGLATLIPEPSSNFEEMIAAADKGLYQAKAAGRDCFKPNNLQSICNMRVFLSQILMSQEESSRVS
ncbi:PleD family two-component system response regulator [Nostoc sp. UHCC 0302]|uniref:GGDEF domain-containing response regulator n=1 Tax=Nostoc sp. UHCC 0302 TaxID=3134896 RepID=UPI00311CAC50